MKLPYVVIPNWNGADMLAECLRSLAQQTLAHRAIVVDNGSVDGSVELIRREFPDVEVLEFADNAGFAGGVNRGIRPALRAGAEYVALLNNDAVAGPEWLERLVHTAKANPRAGMVAGKIVTQDGKHIDSTGDFYSIWGFPYPRGRGEADRGQYDSPGNRRVFAASGGASLYRTAMLREVGLFDERFFAYFEDVDISFRAQLAGWGVAYEPAAAVRHFIGGTSSRMDGGAAKAGTGAPDGHSRPSAFARYHTVKNFSYLYTKSMPGWLYWKYLPLFWASWAMMLVSDARRGLLGSNLRANGTALVHMPGILASRWRIQAQRAVSVAAIDALLVHALPPLQRKRFEQLGWVRPHQ
ncbi:MAG TPA: glycosyltransferase family 2 protein [Candidatus Saccharimonadia bacterium]|nr:glycosyltransferase family 2 protein [Candidatus Saccharimonadia bacterium]